MEEKPKPIGHRLKSVLGGSEKLFGFPPKDKTPSALFRDAISFPEPLIPCGEAVHGMSKTVYVKAVRSHDFSVELGSIPERDDEWMTCAVLSVALHHSTGKRIFPSAEYIADTFREVEIADMYSKVRDLFWGISPLYGWSDWESWQKVLKEGAEDASNNCQAMALGSSFEITGTKIVDRPDRYWGMPLREITDAKWMAYRAARDIVLKHLSEKK